MLLETSVLGCYTVSSGIYTCRMIVVSGVVSLELAVEFVQGRSPRSGKMNILNEQKICFLRSTNFKLLRQIKGNSVNNCETFNFVISVRSGHCYFSPRVSKP